MIRWQRHPLAPGVVEAKPEPPPERTGWCCRCDAEVVVDTLPPTPGFGIPPFHFCTKCGVQIDLEEEAS